MTPRPPTLVQSGSPTTRSSNGSSVADALSAGATGAGPVLLVAGDSAPQATLEAAGDLQGMDWAPGRRLAGRRGGGGARRAAGVSGIERISGDQRFETAA